MQRNAISMKVTSLVRIDSQYVANPPLCYSLQTGKNMYNQVLFCIGLS
jgi:hypothetical protein